MDKEWIANLAQDIKQKGHEAAEEYGRSQHQAGIITAQGKTILRRLRLLSGRRRNEIRRQLQGDVTASETIIKTSGLVRDKTHPQPIPLV